MTHRRPLGWLRSRRLVTGLGLAAVVASASTGAVGASFATDRPADPAGWLQSRYGPAHNADNTRESLLGTGNAGRVRPRWSTPVSRSGWVLEDNPTVTRGVAYLVTWDGHLSAIDAMSGSVLWSRVMPAGTFGTAPVDESAIYAWLANDTLHAYRQSDGRQLWSVPESNGGGVPDSSLTLADGVLYGASWTGDVWARSTSTGAQLWRTRVSFGNFSSPVVWRNEVLAIGDDQAVHALDAATGAVLWRTAINGANWSDPPAVGAGGLAFVVGGGDCTLTALDALSGSVRWSRPLYTPCTFGDSGYVAIDGTDLYVPTYADDLVKVDATTGTVIWKAHLPGVAFGAGYWSRPVIANGVVWVTGSNTLWAVGAATGKRLLAQPTAGAFGEPVVWNGWVYTAEADDALHAYSLSHDPPSGAASVPVLTGPIGVDPAGHTVASGLERSLHP